MSHTPGPWFAERRRRYWGVYTCVKTRDCVGRRMGKSAVARISGDAAASLAHEAEANARLIAAAPRLLAALKRALPAVEHMYHTTLDPDGSLWDDMEECRAAIHDATGAQP